MNLTQRNTTPENSAMQWQHRQNLSDLTEFGEQVAALTDSEENMRILQTLSDQAYQIGRSLVTNGGRPDNYYENHLLSNLYNDAVAINLYWVYTRDDQKNKLFSLCQRLTLANIRDLLVCFER